jgi:hypothetical protein
MATHPETPALPDKPGSLPRAGAQDSSTSKRSTSRVSIATIRLSISAHMPIFERNAQNLEEPGPQREIKPDRADDHF